MLDMAEVVSTYIKLRDRRAERKARYDADDADDKHKMDKLEAYLLKQLNENGMESVRTDNGTAYKVTRTSCSVADWDAFFKFVQNTEAWEFLERRPSKTAVEQFKNETQDLPPGLNWSETQYVNVKRG